jgi:hypothetical protein
MQIAAIRHSDSDALGSIGEALTDAGLEYRYFDLFAGEAGPGHLPGSAVAGQSAGRAGFPQCREGYSWYPVFWRGEVREDSLLCGLGDRNTIFQWHGETFELPAGAVQFHLEVSPLARAIFGRWACLVSQA